MQIRTTLALALAALTIGVPVAMAAPDGYQPQLQANAQTDVIDRYLANNGPDGFQSQPTARAAAPEAGGVDWQVVALGALGGALVIVLLVSGMATVRGRRRLAVR